MKNSIKKATVMSAVSMGADATSSITNIQFLDNVCYQFVWSAGITPIGVLVVQVSVDYDPQQNIAGTWTDLTLPITPSISGNSGSIILDLNQLPAPWVRLFYDRTSGTATANAYLSAKEV